MDGRNEECAMNTGTMSSDCKLNIERLQNNLKESFGTKIEKLEDKIDVLEEELLNLKKDKAEDSALREIKEELIKVQKELSRFSEANNDRKDDISKVNMDVKKLAERLNELFELIAEKNYQEGENAAMLQNVADNILHLTSEMREGFREQNVKIEKNKPLSWSEQISIFIDGKWYKKIFVGFVAFMMLSFGFGAFAFYTGNQTTFFDILEIVKGFLN